MAKKFFNSVSNAFTGVFALVAVFFAAVCMFSSCSDLETTGELPTFNTVDTLIKDGDTIFYERVWKPRFWLVNRGDTTDVFIEFTSEEENLKKECKGRIYIYAEKTGYPIFSDVENITAAFANAGATGGKTVRTEQTDTSWVERTLWSSPTQCANMIGVVAEIPHLKGMPAIHAVASEILSFVDPRKEASTTRSAEVYKVDDSPRRVYASVTFETEGMARDTTFKDTINTRFERDLMAYNDVDHREIVSKGTRALDPTTLRDSIHFRYVMKNKETNEAVEYNLRKNLFENVAERTMDVHDFSGYGFDHVIGISSYDGEKEVSERSTGNWTVLGKKDLYSAAIAGEIPFTTEYYLYTERAQYRDDKWGGVKVDFDYIVPTVKESKETTTIKLVTSDRAKYDKAVVTNDIKIDYAGFTTPLSEIMNLYKEEAKKDPQIIKTGFEIITQKRDWEPNLMTPSVVHYRLWDNGLRETTTHSMPMGRTLTNGPAYARVANSNYNLTGKPSILPGMKNTERTYTDENGGKWSSVEQSGTIAADVEFNGAEKATITWTFTEHNKVRLVVDGDTLYWGEDSYNFTLKPSLGEGSVEDGYTVYPYKGELNYIFADAPAKQSTDTGVIKVKKEKVLKKKGFEKEIIWGVTSNTYKAIYFEEYDDNTRDEVPFSWVRPSTLTDGPEFERIASDNTNNTSEPKMTTKTSPDSYTEKGGVWTGTVETSTISSTVSFNGAKSADVIFTATETNDIKLEYKGEVCDFGHFTYSYNLTPKLGAGSVSGDYTVYPYTAKLNYKFGEAAAKQATDTGKILVEVPKEERFFKEEWGDLESVTQTTTLSQNKQYEVYVLSLHFYNKKTGKRYVLPVILDKNTPHKPEWNFSQVEECNKATYDLYNSAFYFTKSGKWVNTVAEDAREWMQWSTADTGTAKKAYGTMLYDTAKAKYWDHQSFKDGRPTVFTHRYGLTVKDGRLFVIDTYENVKVTDSNCVDGGWK